MEKEQDQKTFIREELKKRNWSYKHLAKASGYSLRSIEEYLKPSGRNSKNVSMAIEKALQNGFDFDNEISFVIVPPESSKGYKPVMVRMESYEMLKQMAYESSTSMSYTLTEVIKFAFKHFRMEE